MIYGVVGLFAGILAGLLGVGGGLVIVPVLLFVFQSQSFAPEILMHLAVATSLASIMFTSISSAWAHHRRGAVLWRAFTVLGPGVAAGAVLGGLVADRLSSDALRIIFGVFGLLVAWQLAADARPAPGRRLPGTAGLAGAGAGIGALSSILGIGGGAMTVPFLLWCNTNMRNAVATAAACGFPIAVAGSGAMIAAGWGHPGLPGGATGYVFWPAAIAIAVTSVLAAPLGAALAHRLPVSYLRRAFAVIVVLVCLRLLL